MISLDPAQWVRRPRRLSQPALRLFCLPYAGGDHTLFQRWPDLLPEAVRDHLEICPIQLPGRAHRIREYPLFTSMPMLINTLVPPTLAASPLAPWLDRPFAFFGASLGGLIAFELARALSTRHQLSPVALCVAACRAPHLPGPHPLEGMEHFSDEEVIEHVRALGGTPEYVLADARLLPVILPKLRADALLEATYAYVPDVALDCPITVCGGEQDVFVGLPELVAWQAHTYSTFRLQQFPGDHFFVRDAPARDRTLLLEQIVRACCKTCEQISADARPAPVQR
ncbi:thioesterase II family protein [Thermogemmatispora tikiterensis]|uniref:Thioesterase domain-containing protein n=1 Tax=Thermogemmatispora tikiterensis TaxID=1825093 RepID=A0A328VB29_9CHLR|nr:thioesterase domain-containing protein [Thermogemmatispora tikiterensis]RAQ93959.1 hypothetical protein A4R35_00345 [Thermogemmatispora tikiterensis]